MRILSLFFLFLSIPVWAVNVGLEQTFGSDNYTGTRAPLVALHVEVDHDNPKFLDIGMDFDTYKDDFIRTRFFAFEPKLRVFAEREAGVAVSYRFVPSTDDFTSSDIGVAINYVIMEGAHSDKQPAPLIEEVELAGQVHRKTYGDALDSTLARRSANYELTETSVSLAVEFRTPNRGSAKPNIHSEIVKAFYANAIGATERPAPITAIPGLIALTQGYLNFAWYNAAYWDLGRIGGFFVQPRVFLSILNMANSAGGSAFGFTIAAGASGFGVKTGLEFLTLGAVTRSFLTLGASVAL